MNGENRTEADDTKCMPEETIVGFNCKCSDRIS